MNLSCCSKMFASYMYPDVIESVFLKFFKMILGMKRSTPNFMVYGETGTYPISVDNYCRMIIF